MSLSTLMSVNGVNKAALFVELYNSAKVFNHAEVQTITRGDAEKILSRFQQFGKFCGKYMEIDFGPTTLNFFYYNARNKSGAGQAAVKRVIARQQNKPPVHVLRELEKRKNPSVQTRQNNTNDFIPNANSGTRNIAFMYGNNTTAMNIIHPPRRSRSIDTSSIYNPATLPANIPARKKQIQVINPRFNPELYVISNTELTQILNEYVPPSNDEQESSNIPDTPKSPSVQDTPDSPKTVDVSNAPNIPDTPSSPKTSSASSTTRTTRNSRSVESIDVGSFDTEPQPVRVQRQVVQKKHVESHVPIPEPMPAPPVPRDEPLVIPTDGVLIDAVVDGEEKTNEPVPVNRFRRANRKKQSSDQNNE